MSDPNAAAPGAPGVGPAGAGVTPAPVRLVGPPATAVLVAPTLNLLRGITGTITPLPASLPVAGTQSGNLLSDRNDPNLRWYLPAFTLATPDPAFAFAATQTSVDQSGNPFDQAVLTLSVQVQDPADVQQARAANPGLRFQQIPLDNVSASLNLPYKDASGADATTTVAGQLTQQGGTLQLAVNGLLGPAVIQAYQQLTSLAQATVTLQLNYAVWQQEVRWVWSGLTLRQPPERVMFPPTTRVGQPARLEAVQPARLEAVQPARLEAVQPAALVTPAAPAIRPGGPPPIRVGPGGPPNGGGSPHEFWFTTTATFTSTLQLGSAFSADQYRPRYTITPAGGTTRPIIDVNDLREFDVDRSEFRELTSLGDVQRRYPSLARLYYGQVTGTVIAVPVQYGIVCGSKGCAARLDAVVDPAGLSGSRFHLTFVLAPVVDPIDFARLAHDLASVPEAQNRGLTLRLPGGLDSRGPATLGGLAAASASYANGQEEGALLLAVDIADSGTTPAVVNVNLFLTQLTTPGPTLFGQIGVRLDDIYTPVVNSSVILNLTSTSNTDDILVTLAGSPAVPSVTNQAPFDLHITAFADIAANVTEINIDERLASAQTLALPGADPAAQSIAVSRSIPVPNPFPRQALFSYVDVHTENVQTIRHALIVNATAVDFTARQISQADIQFTLKDLPTIPVNSLTLTPAHRVDEVAVTIPIVAAITALNVTLTVTITGTDRSQRQVELSNDFAANPIYLITDL
jgi:hypothetical protein